MNRIHYSTCPVCDSPDIHPLLSVKDHSVSGEEFVIWQCNRCLLRFTQDVPDGESIAPYYQSADYISHSNTDKGLVNQLYQRVRKTTLQQKAKLVMQYTKPTGSLLDIGAGIGAFLQVMKEKGWEAMGVEPDEGARARAKDLFGLELLPAGALQSLPGATCDAVTLWHVLEHVHSLHDYMEQLKALLRSSGKIFIAVPNYQSLDAEVYKNFWAAYDVPRHLYHFSPSSIQHLVERHGLRLIAKKPMWYDSFYISLLSSKYYKGKTSWLSAGLTGLRSNMKTLFNKDKCSSVIYIIEKAS